MPHQCTNCGYVFADGSKEMLSGCPECSGATFQFYPDDTEIPETPPDESPPDPEGGRVSKHVGNATSTVRGWMSGGSSSSDTSSSSNPSETADDTEKTADDTEVSNHTVDIGTSNTTETKGAGNGSDTMVDEYGIDGYDIDEDEADVLENEVRDSEDAAQADARSEFVSPDEIPSSSTASSTSQSSSLSSSELQTSSSLTSPPSDGRIVRGPTGDRPDLSELREELNDQFESIKIIEPGEYELNLMGLYDREEYIIALQENGRYVIQMPETWLGNDDE